MTKEVKKENKDKKEKGYLSTIFIAVACSMAASQATLHFINESKASDKAAQSVQRDIQEIRSKTGLGTSYPGECSRFYDAKGSERADRNKPASLDCGNLVKILKSTI